MYLHISKIHQRIRTWPSSLAKHVLLDNIDFDFRFIFYRCWPQRLTCRSDLYLQLQNKVKISSQKVISSMLSLLCHLNIIKIHKENQIPGVGTQRRPFPTSRSNGVARLYLTSTFSPSTPLNMTKFGNLTTDSGVQALNDYLGDRSYVEG